MLALTFNLFVYKFFFSQSVKSIQILSCLLSRLPLCVRTIKTILVFNYSKFLLSTFHLFTIKCMASSSSVRSIWWIIDDMKLSNDLLVPMIRLLLLTLPDLEKHKILTLPHHLPPRNTCQSILIPKLFLFSRIYCWQ